MTSSQLRTFARAKISEIENNADIKQNGKTIIDIRDENMGAAFG